MAIDILSWNIKSFASCVEHGGDRLTIIRRLMLSFDLIFVYEVPNSQRGTSCLTTLVNNLNNTVGRNYHYFSNATGGLNAENDRIAVIYDSLKVTVVDTTFTRRPPTPGGREPIYCNVTELGNMHIREFCSWHAPKPSETLLISQGWKNILQNTENHHGTQLTGVIVGDFNGVLGIPRRGSGESFVRKIHVSTGTTLKSSDHIKRTDRTTIDYRTSNTYDQFYVNSSLIPQGNVTRSGVIDVLAQLVAGGAPFPGTLNGTYNTPAKAYAYYFGSLSDHLPVGMSITL